MKKVISIILSVILTLGILPVRAGAILPDEPSVYRYSKSETVDYFDVSNGEVLVIPKGVCITVDGESWIGYGQIVIEKDGRLIFKNGDHIISKLCSIICEGRLEVWEGASLSVENGGSLLVLPNGMLGVRGDFSAEEGASVICLGKYKGSDKSVPAKVTGAQVFLRDYDAAEEDDKFIDTEFTDYSAEDAAAMLPKDFETSNSQEYSDGILDDMTGIFYENEWHIRWTLSNGGTLEMAVNGDPERRRMVFISGVRLYLQKAPMQEVTADKNLLYRDDDVRVKLTKPIDDFDDTCWDDLEEEELYAPSDFIARVTVQELSEADVFSYYNGREWESHITLARVSIDETYKGRPKEEKETYTVAFPVPMSDMHTTHLSFPELIIGESYILFMTDPENIEDDFQLLARYTDFYVDHPSCSVRIEGKKCICDEVFSGYLTAEKNGNGKYEVTLAAFRYMLKKKLRHLG